MAKDTHVVDSFENALFQHFSSDRMGDEMAHILSKITINWGKLEQALYLSIKASLSKLRFALTSATAFMATLLE